MSGKYMVKLTGVLLLALRFLCGGVKAQVPPLPPFPSDPYLDSWSFYDPTNWFSDLGYAPISFTNIVCDQSSWASDDGVLDCNGLILDSTNPAYLNYKVVEHDHSTNLICSAGTIWFWFSPDWSSTNQGGTGPADWGRFIDVGAWTSNAEVGWWSLLLSPDGDNIYFSGQTNGVGTNYLSFPISWASNSWHLIGLTYTPTNSLLYVDGQLATNGLGVSYWPGQDVLTNGFLIGSDYSGTQQARGEFIDVEMWADRFSSNYFSNYYTRTLPELPGASVGRFGGTTGDFSPPGGGGGDGGGGGSYTPSYAAPDYGTNLWIAQISLASGYLTGIASNTIADVQYEIMTNSDLTNTNWGSTGLFIHGSETTNWTILAPLLVSSTNNVFIRLRSWVSSDGSGLPDWWELQYFGHLGVDPDAPDPAGDGKTIWQDFEAGNNPNVFNSSAGPNNLTVRAVSGTSAVLTWTPSPGPVTSYSISSWNAMLSQFQTFDIGPTNQYLATNFIQYAPWQSSITYYVSANYANGTNYGSQGISSLISNPTTAQVLPVIGDSTMLMVLNLPSGAAGVQATRVDWSSYYSPQAVASSNSFYIPASSFNNGLYTIPTNEVGLGPQGSSWYVQNVWSNGITGTKSMAVAAGFHLAGPTTYDFIPGRFDDASTQMVQNVVFLLRAASLTAPFVYVFDSGYGVAPVNQPTNYAYAGFWNVNDSSGDGIGGDPRFFWSLPFQQNYRLRNFVFSTTNSDSSGMLNTGGSAATYEYLTGIEDFYLDSSPTFYFATTNTTTSPGLLSSTQTTWITPYGDPSLVGIAASSSQLTLSNNIYNYFGLKLLSVLVAHNHNSVRYLDVLDAGNTMPATNDSYYFYPQYDMPNLHTVGYYFGKCGFNAISDYGQLVADPMPGTIYFSPTNAQPLLIASTGVPFYLAAFAKQTILNGDTDKPVYVSQYFDKAYKVDANGNVTTNQTGVLSAYSVFVADAPGPVALVTRPSSDGQRGTGIVQVVSLVLDANHDGNMDMSISGADYTTPNHPMSFWVNDLYDQPGANGNLDKELPIYPNQTGYYSTNAQPNYAYGQIRCQRNLENLARLWIRGMPKLPTNQGCTAQLSLDYYSWGEPVNLYAAYETNGGIGYLTDTNIAAAQVSAPYGDELAHFDVWGSNNYDLPLDSQGNLTLTNFLFEGQQPGFVGLMLSIYQNGVQIGVVESYVNFDEVKNLYEMAAITNVVQTWPEMVQQTNASSFQVLTSPDNNQFEAQQLALFIHGWRMTAWDTECFSDTMFKRLYWQGYQGRFASLRWPTRSADTDTNGMDYFTFNRSEHIAFESGTGAAAYLNNLRNRYTNYTVSVCAHSQGNILMMQALKELAASNQSPLDNYVMMQAAVPAQCYDTTAPNYQSFLDAETSISPTPNTYANYAAGITNTLRNGGKISNFFNTNDFALVSATILGGTFNSSYIGNETWLKPLVVFGYYYTASNAVAHVTTNLYQAAFGATNVQIRVLSDPLELMPFVARPRSLAVGAQGGVGQVVNGGELNLAPLGFGNQNYDHSGEFNRNIQDPVVQSFYPQLIIKLFP